MSSHSDSPARTGSETLDAAHANQPTLPTFAPVRDRDSQRWSHAESSASGSRRSVSALHKRSRLSLGDGSSPINSDGVRDKYSLSSAPRKQENRSSGGFLLDGAAKSARLSKSLLLQVHQNDRREKRRSDDSQLVVAKRRTRDTLTPGDASLTNSKPPSEAGIKELVSQSPQSGSSIQKDGAVGDTDSMERDGAKGYRLSSSITPSSVGYDTDPAQIVDMALRLSEGRRRYASGQRHVSGNLSRTPARNTTHIGARSVSTATGNPSASPPAPTTPTKTFHPKAPADISPAVGKDVQQSPSIPDQVDGGVLEISRATALRVEKAKNYLELIYEHRRLLVHLPPLLRPDGTLKPKHYETEGRVYNPLQYVRNRKLRLRGKSGINGEAEGWHDVVKVRAWVDTVIRSHEEASHDPLECVRLPPLSLRDDQEVDAAGVGPPQSPRATNQNATRPRRPKSDWITHPGDILADTHWLEQGLNKTKIQDRENNHIYPPDTQFKFSGWRNHTPIKVPENLQMPIPSPEEPEASSFEVRPLESAPALPTFRSSHPKKNKKRKNEDDSKKLRKSITKERYRSDKRDTKVTNADNFDTQSTASSSSEEERHPRGRRRTTDKPHTFNQINGDPFDQSGTKVKDEPIGYQLDNASDPNLSAQGSKRSSIDQNLLVKYLKRNKGTFEDKDRRRDSTDHERYPRSSFEGDSTAPASPITETWPSIAINLSPPASRSPSPVKKRHSILHSILEARHNRSREGIDWTDFATPGSRSHSRESSVDKDALRESPNHSRGTSPRTRGPSPLTRLSTVTTAREEPPVLSRDPRSNVVGRTSTKSGMNTADHPARVRGMFKGGRIAELVGNEVSRVGDFIWKREAPATRSSLESYSASDTEPGSAYNNTLNRSPTLNRKISSSTRTSYKEARLSQDSDVAPDSSQYHNPNLPSFTSPFQRDREKRELDRVHLSPDSAVSGDHITRAAAQHRSRSRSPRLERLAPPKLDTNRPASAGPDDRRQSYGFGPALDLSGSLKASQAFNDAIEGRSARQDSTKGNGPRPAQQIHSAAAEISCAQNGYVNKQDLVRIETLLLMTAVKAKGLVTFQNDIPPRPSAFVRDQSALNHNVHENSDPPHVRRREEHAIAAQTLIAALDRQNANVHERLTAFSEAQVAKLHKDLQVLEDLIENTLTPRVRTAVDDAGALSQKLITTSTLAVKDVNDLISESFRIKKRGPFRWLRYVGYGAIEWAVIGLLWIIWFVVTIIRFFIDTMKNTWKLLRWLFWMA